MLVQTKDEQMMQLIDTIGQHYRTNIGNRYVRSALRTLQLDQKEWDLIESVTEKASYYQHQGYHLDELYERILVLGRFVYHARKELQPKLRMLLTAPSSGPSPVGTDKVLRDMAVNNFGSNLSILADLVQQLYRRAVELDDQMTRPRAPVHTTMPELKNLGGYLVPN